MTKKFLSLLLALIVTAICASCKKDVPSEPVTYGSVNGEEITNDEIEYFTNRLKPDIITYYMQNYEITDIENFWDEDFGGETASHMLSRLAFDEAVRAKTELILMKEHGIYEDISFRALKQLADKYNEEHGTDEDFVGLQTLSDDSFYLYFIATGRTELQYILAEDVLKPGDDELEAAGTIEGINPDDPEAVIMYVVREKYNEYITQLVKDADVVNNTAPSEK